jgi:hypothetical protein
MNTINNLLTSEFSDAIAVRYIFVSSGCTQTTPRQDTPLVTHCGRAPLGCVAVFCNLHSLRYDSIEVLR